MAIEAKSLSKDVAVERAAESLGMGKLNQATVKAEVVTLTDQSLPFLHDRLRGKQTWRIQLTDLPLTTVNSQHKVSNSYVRNWTVFLCPETGFILSAISKWPENEARIAPYPPVDIEEEQMQSASKEYTGLPKTAPTITLKQALSAAMGWSDQARQVSAHYILESSIKYKNRAVWIVHVRGITPLSPPVPEGAKVTDIPVDARNHLRNVIDAQTGEWLGASSIPQPVNGTSKELPALEDRY